MKLPVTTVVQYLENGKNVFVSGVDSYWNYYFDLNKLALQYYTFHAIATTWSPKVFEKWGFTLCCCISGYRVNNKTIHLIRQVLSRCGEKCSDREVSVQFLSVQFNNKGF